MQAQQGSDHRHSVGQPWCCVLSLSANNHSQYRIKYSRALGGDLRLSGLSLLTVLEPHTARFGFSYYATGDQLQISLAASQQIDPAHRYWPDHILPKFQQ